MEAGEHDLAREMSALEKDEEQAKLGIEAELRAEHAGLEPERPPAWRSEPAPPGEPPPGQ